MAVDAHPVIVAAVAPEWVDEATGHDGLVWHFSYAKRHLRLVEAVRWLVESGTGQPPHSARRLGRV